MYRILVTLVQLTTCTNTFTAAQFVRAEYAIQLYEGALLALHAYPGTGRFLPRVPGTTKDGVCMLPKVENPELSCSFHLRTLIKPYEYAYLGTYLSPQRICTYNTM